MTDTSLDMYIVDGNITCFLGQHSNSFKQDVLNSSLLANLASISNGIASDAWFHAYMKLLGSLYWTTKSHASRYPKIKSVSVLKLAQLALSNYLSTVEQDQLAKCLAFIKKLPEDSDARSALLHRIQSTDMDNDQPLNTVCPLLTIVCENKMIISSIIRFETVDPVDVTILDEELPLKKIIGAPQINQWITYLEESDYADARNLVIGKLGSKIKTKLFHLDATPLSH